MEKQDISLSGAWELCALALVLALLWVLAAPLVPVSLGLDQRYLSLSDSPGTTEFIANEWLGSHAAQALAALACAGYLSMRLARMSIPASTALLSWAAIWLAVAAWMAPNLNPPVWTNLVVPHSWQWSAVALLLALLLAIRSSHRNRLPAQQPVHALAYPGFVLFTGLGALWLLDYSARGRPQWLELGHQHVMSLAIAYATLGLTARFAPVGFEKLARLWARWDRSTISKTRWQRVATRWMPWVLCAAVTIFIALNTNPIYPSKGAELIRLVICLMGAWLIYRWSPLPHHLWRITMSVGLVAVLGTAGLMLIKEFGQLMVLSWATSVLCGALTAWGWLRWRESRSLARFNGPNPSAPHTVGAVMTGSILALALALGGQVLLRSDALATYLQSHRHISMRLAAIQTEGEGPLSYLTELRWFMHSSPLTGHGLGHIPWCGTVGQFGKAWATCSSVKEMHADYVMAALVGVWGWPTALLITSALALWSLSLLRPQAMRLGNLDSSGLTQAFGLCFVTVTLMQLLVTCLGNIGLIPLTGVNFPFLGFGGASLLVCTVGMGVLLHQPCRRS